MGMTVMRNPVLGTIEVTKHSFLGFFKKGQVASVLLAA